MVGRDARNVWAGMFVIALAACALALPHLAHATSLQCQGSDNGGGEGTQMNVTGGAREHNAITVGNKGLDNVRVIDAGVRNRGVPINFDAPCNFPGNFSFDTIYFSLGDRGDFLYLLNPKVMRQDGFKKLDRSLTVRADGGPQNDALLGHAGIDNLRGERGRDVVFGSNGA